MKPIDFNIIQNIDNELSGINHLLMPMSGQLIDFYLYYLGKLLY